MRRKSPGRRRRDLLVPAQLPLLVPAHEPAPRKRAVDARYAFDPMRGGRQTQPGNYNPFGLQGWYFIPKREYQDIDVTELDVSQFTADQLLALLPDLSPEFSKAVWNYLRIAGTTVEFEVTTLSGSEHGAGQRELDDIVLGVNPMWGGIDAIVRQLLLSAYLQGACSCEAAPTASLRDVDDIYAVSPDSIWFQRDSEQKLVAFQRQAIWGNLAAAYPYRMMNEETFVYVPVDAFIDDPYGRAPAAPALQTVFAMVAVMRDLQRWVHHQGYPRVDISLVYELLEHTMPPDVQEDDAKKYDWMRGRMNEVVSTYNTMAPEDAFVHWDFVNVEKSMGEAGRRGLDVEAIVHVFRIELIESLKSLPIFHSEHTGSTETYGSVEYEIQGASVDTLRAYTSQALERALTVGLHFRGIQAVVEAHWPPIRTTQRLADAQAESQEIENEVNKRDQGWVTQDDASEAITESKAVGPAPEPNVMPAAVLKPAPQTAATPVTFPPAAAGTAPAGPAGETGTKPASDEKTAAEAAKRIGLAYASGFGSIAAEIDAMYGMAPLIRNGRVRRGERAGVRR